MFSNKFDKIQRSAYDATVETSLYVDPDFVNAGVGSILYEGLLEKLRALGLHVAMAIITVPNIPSTRDKQLDFIRLKNN